MAGALWAKAGSQEVEYQFVEPFLESYRIYALW
jgi:DNA/RNA endonuclease YhcR with UshA esterase domain